MVDALDPALGSTTKVRLLRQLLRSPARQWTGRELARAAGVSTAQAARDLKDLLDVGVVGRQVHGRSFAWSWRQKHALSSGLASLFSLESDLRANLETEIARELLGLPIQRALLFGSVANGDERADSDVDIFVQVRSQSDKARVEDALEKVRERVWSRFGNPVSSLVYTSAEVARPRNPDLLREIEREGLPLLVNGRAVHGENHSSP